VGCLTWKLRPRKTSQAPYSKPTFQAAARTTKNTKIPNHQSRPRRTRCLKTNFRKVLFIINNAKRNEATAAEEIDMLCENTAPNKAILGKML
jgi:hypothetical protein